MYAIPIVLLAACATPSSQTAACANCETKGRAVEESSGTASSELIFDSSHTSGVLSVNTFSVTCDGSPIVLWPISGQEFSVDIKVSGETNRKASKQGNAYSHRTLDSLQIEVGTWKATRGALAEMQVPCVDNAGRSTESALLSMRPSVRHQRQLALDCDNWQSLLVSSGRADALTKQQCALFQRLGVGFGLGQIVPDGDAQSLDVASLFVEWLDGCFANLLANAEQDIKLDGTVISVPATSARVYCESAFISMWAYLWRLDRGVRDIDPESFSESLRFELKGKSKMLERTPGVVVGAKSSGEVSLLGRISFTTKNESWPANWTIDVDLSLTWDGTSTVGSNKPVPGK